ncbi:cell division cycle protein [Trypanosoma theileri]|uniref:Cell division cycle protein n=1 Tax=Trypanosoma theileri TaxID=67003 RepID=A0A1X0NXH5_9TRYP|nr:cell division cycle protein [Trypanosoma theileri]ORC88919.1 cell division cycle protein [Trypanosoma theileri]
MYCTFSATPFPLQSLQSVIKKMGETYMSGATDVLVVIAPVAWWPSAQFLHFHPFDAGRTFASAITSSGVAVGAAERVVGLSRLGRSVMLSATLEDSTVRLYNPFSGGELRLAIRRDCSEYALASGVSLYELVEADRVRVEAAPVGMGVLLCEVQLEDHDLGERYVAAALKYITQHLQWQQKRQRSVCSLLITGEHGVGKTHTLYQVAVKIPQVVNVCGKRYVVERRDVSVAQLLQLDEREAVTVIQRICALPPIDTTENPNYSSTAGVILLLTLDGVDLLWATTNSLVALVSHQLCASLDEMDEAAQLADYHIVLIATAENTTTLPTALLSRLSSRRVHIAYPSLQERLNYMEMQSGAMDFPPHVRERVAELLAGYTAGQLAVMNNNTLLQMLEREATLDAKQHHKEQRHQNDTQLDTKNENVADTYGGLIGMANILRDLEELVVWPLQHMRLLRRYGVTPPKGVVVCGPSGSGKTSLLTSLARRLRSGRLHVMLVDGLTLIEKAVGRTEKNIATLFANARATSPTVLFLDNIDSLAPPRGRQMSEVSNTADRTLSTLLTVMDGISGSSNGDDFVFVVASAPSIAALDPAISRPGRLDVHLTLPMPTAEELHLYIVRRLLVCVTQCAGGENNNDDNKTNNTDNDVVDDEEKAEMVRIVEEYASRWTAMGRLSAAEANAFVREVVLHMVESSSLRLVDRLKEALDAAATRL